MASPSSPRRDEGSAPGRRRPRDVLGPAQRPILEELARARALLAFDYDGVLAPLVTEPTGAPMRPRTRSLLVRLGRRWPCAVVSGRAFEHTVRLTRGAVPLVVGNHGYELLRARPVPHAIVREVRGWREALERELAGVPGIHFEDKRSTLSIHFGLGRRWRAAERAARAAAGRLAGARIIGGKRVVNVVPKAFPTKGDALRVLLRRLHLDVALYAGDDVTDEDAFAVGLPLVLGIRVGEGRTAAPYRLADQLAVDRLLETLLELRAGAGRVRRAPARAGGTLSRRPAARAPGPERG